MRSGMDFELFELNDGAFIAAESNTIIKSGSDEDTLFRMLLKSGLGAAKQETHPFMSDKVKRYIPGYLAGGLMVASIAKS